MKHALVLVATLSFLPACTTSGGGGAAASYPEFRPIQGGGILYTWFGGLDALMVDPKDAGVRDALRHLGTRLAELPAETGDAEIPGEELALAATLLAGEGTFALGESTDPASGLPVRAQLTFRGASEAHARAHADALARALSKLDLPSLGLDEALGLSTIDMGMFQVLHGVAKAGRADTLTVAVGGLDTQARDHGTLDLPADARPALAWRFDYGALAALLETFGGPEASAALDLVGVGDLVIQGAVGHGPEACHASTRTLGFVPAARAAGTLPESTITRATLARIPADATMAWVASANLANVGPMLRRLAQIENAGDAVDPLGFVRDFLGLDLESELFAHLGGTLGVYTSDATGGGGHYSWIAFVEARDERALRDGLARLTARLEDLADENDLPSLVVRRTTHAGAQLSTFSTLGLPIPLELTWAVHGGALYAGLSVQGVRAAIDHATRGGDSIMDVEAFRRGLPAPVEGSVSMWYFDVPRFAREAYPLAAMLGAALSNGLVSTSDPERVPAGIVPGFADFARGARATVAVGRFEGDDLVVRARMDRSILVQGAGYLGMFGSFLPLAVMLPAIVAERAAEAQGIPLPGFDSMGQDGAIEFDMIELEGGEMGLGGPDDDPDSDELVPPEPAPQGGGDPQ